MIENHLSSLEFVNNNIIIERQIIKQQKLIALRAQMSTHFIFNALNSIKYFVIKNEVDNSTFFLDKFAQLMRKTLENSNFLYVPISNEINTLKEYLDLEKLRIEEKLNYEINIEKNINTETSLIPTLLLQPFVENSIWHGVALKKEGGKVIIKIKEVKNKFVCIIDDNGVGRNEQKKESNYNARKSQAINISKARLDLMNSSSSIVNLKIIDKKDSYGNSKGTRVELYFPNDLKLQNPNIRSDSEIEEK